MSPFKRRHFLQAAGATLASIGLSQWDVLHQANHYGRVLAQGSPGRKLALLVGVNAYPDKISNLKGCLTDVELQRELLVHRYGFNPKDILIVSDQEALKPNREIILEAFEKHLIQQAKPGDVVVFHFSGHGSLVRDPNPLKDLIVNQNGVLKTVPNTERLNGTLVPFDRATSNPEQVQDIMGSTLFLLMAALQTENVTVVLDSCHSGGGTRGNVLFRSVSSRIDGRNLAVPSATEIEYQQRWMKKLGLSEAELQRLRSQGIAKGVAIGSANYDQLAADAPFDRDTFFAGAFTYTLTRYLWQQAENESIGRVFTNLARSTRSTTSGSTGQEPIFAANPKSNDQQPLYFLKPTQPFAEAVVRDVKPDGTVEYWLGGISSVSLAANQKGTLFSVVDASGKEIAQIEQETREGLTGLGKVRQGNKSAVKPGALLRERVRGLPTNLKLRVGLDDSLAKDRDAIAAALKSLPQVELVASNQSMNYRLGRVTAEYQQAFRTQSVSQVPKPDSIGLLTGDLRPLTATFNEPGEKIVDAINRLTPRFQSLLAAEILRAIGGLDVVTGGQSTSVAMQVKSTGKSGGQVRGNQFKPGTEIQIQVKNNTQRDLFVGVVSIGSAGNLRVLFPYWDAPDDRARVAPGQELTLPEDGVTFPLSKTPGALEVITFASVQPIRTALAALRTIGERGGVSSGRGVSPTPMRGDDALTAMDALLGNVDRNTRSDIDVSAQVRGVDTAQFSMVSTLIEVVPS